MRRSLILCIGTAAILGSSYFTLTDIASAGSRRAVPGGRCQRVCFWLARRCSQDCPALCNEIYDPDKTPLESEQCVAACREACSVSRSNCTLACRSEQPEESPNSP